MPKSVTLAYAQRQQRDQLTKYPHYAHRPIKTRSMTALSGAEVTGFPVEGSREFS